MKVIEEETDISTGNDDDNQGESCRSEKTEMFGESSTKERIICSRKSCTKM